jgi:hypothetical protein
MAPNRPFVFGVDLDGAYADFYRGLRPIAAEWLGVYFAMLSERVSWCPVSFNETKVMQTS